jgi:predicted MPP superfamily phosphohydrolase
LLHVRNEATIKILRILLRLLLIGLIAGLVLIGWAYWTAGRDPVIRDTRIEIAGWPAGERRLRILLASDIHVAGPDMPPERLARIVAQINALEPDLVLIAGDFISEKAVATQGYSFAQITAPLAGLRPKLGTIAVLGNHDHWANGPAMREALEQAGVRVLFNDAVRVGPLAIGGLDDDFTGRADLGRTLAAMQAAGGIPVLLSHSPDPFPDVPVSVPLMLAGHTHCGQISPPLIGPLRTYSRYGTRYACGRIDEDGKVLVVGAGLGTSVLPLRIGAVPDLWLIELGPR